MAVPPGEPLAGGRPRALFVTDLDGTLLGPDRELPPANREALAAAAADGIAVAIVTGRRRSTVSREYPKLAGLDFRVAVSNGSVILGPDRHEPRLIASIDWARYEALAARVDLGGGRVFCITAPAGGPAGRDGSIDCFEHEVGTGRWLAATSPYQKEPLVEVPRRVAQERPLVHVAMQIPERGQADRLAAALRAEVPPEVSVHVVVSPAGAGALTELVPRGGKGNALRFLAGELGVAPEATGAVGDELNDCDLLGAAARRYAVGGSWLARARPDAVEVGDAASGAVADALRRFREHVG